MKTSRILLVGLVIIVALGFLVFGLNYLKGNNFFSSDKIYYVKYPKVQGLKVSNPVMINGFKVGQVKEIKLILDSKQYILVKLAVKESVALNKKSVAMIYSLDLMGSKGIDLQLNNSSELLLTNDTIQSSVEQDIKDQVSAQILPLKLKVEDLVGSIDDAMKLVKDLFNKTNTNNVESTLRNLNRTFYTLNHTSKELDSLLTNGRPRLERIFANIESLSTNLTNNNEQISLIMNNLALISDSLAKSQIKSTIYMAQQTLEQTNEIMHKINNGEGSIGMLLNNKTLYKNLEASTRDLDRLLLDVRENPKRYIHYSLFDFGKTVVVDKEGLDKVKNKTKDEYFLQIKSSKERIEQSSNQFKGHKKITEHYIDGLYKYTAGSSPSYKKMKRLRKKLNKDFPDAFITSYKKDSIIVE